MLKMMSAIADTKTLKATISILADELNNELLWLEKQLPVERKLLQWTVKILANEFENVT